MKKLVSLILNRQSWISIGVILMFASSVSFVHAKQNRDEMIPFPKRFDNIKRKANDNIVKQSEQQAPIQKIPESSNNQININETQPPSRTIPATNTVLVIKQKKVPPQKLTPASPPDYLIGHEDVLEIAVWRNEELSAKVIVRPDGKISLPLIGDVQASGLTPDQLRQNIVKKLVEYQETVVVSVIVREVNSFNIFLLGEIRNNGTFSLKRKTTLIQAVALAGGFTQFASKNKILVIRNDEASGKEQKINIRFDDIIRDKDSEDNIVLKPGDTIFVP